MTDTAHFFLSLMTLAIGCSFVAIWVTTNREIHVFLGAGWFIIGASYVMMSRYAIGS